MLCWYIIKGKSALIVCPPQFYRNYKTLKSSKWYLQKCSSWFRPINSSRKILKINFQNSNFDFALYIVVVGSGDIDRLFHNNNHWFHSLCFRQSIKVVRMSIVWQMLANLTQFFLCAENEWSIIFLLFAFVAGWRKNNLLSSM